MIATEVAVLLLMPPYMCCTQVPFAACLAHWSGDEVVSDVWSAAAGKRCAATKHTRFATFPPYLMVALK